MWVWSSLSKGASHLSGALAPISPILTARLIMPWVNSLGKPERDLDETPQGFQTREGDLDVKAILGPDGPLFPAEDLEDVIRTATGRGAEKAAGEFDIAHGQDEVAHEISAIATDDVALDVAWDERACFEFEFCVHQPTPKPLRTCAAENPG